MRITVIVPMEMEFEVGDVEQLSRQEKASYLNGLLNDVRNLPGVDVEKTVWKDGNREEILVAPEKGKRFRNADLARVREAFSAIRSWSP